MHEAMASQIPCAKRCTGMWKMPIRFQVHFYRVERKIPITHFKLLLSDSLKKKIKKLRYQILQVNMFKSIVSS